MGSGQARVVMEEGEFTQELRGNNLLLKSGAQEPVTAPAPS